MSGTTEAPGEHAGDLLRRMRMERALTQEDLAERFAGGISVDTISNIERGRVRARRHTLLGLMDALGIDAAGRAAVMDAWRGQTASETPATGARARMPSPITTILGRESELSLLEGLLTADGVRLVTLTGPGGVGKTRLAIAAAEAVAPRIRHGVAFIDLTPLRDADRLLPTLAFELGLADAGDRPAQERLTAHLAGREILLLLDNCEGIAQGSARLMPLLEECPGLRLLVTSREALRLRGEHEVAVAPLPLPDAGQTGEQALVGVPSVRLLLQRGQMVSPGLRLTPSNAMAVAQICSRLDGLPLALELAGARLKHLAPEALAARLERALSVLVDGPRDLPERQRTLRATIDWSYELLTEQEQRLLRKLAVFAGGCTAEAVARVCLEDASGLDGLLDKNLLRVIDEGSEAEPRFGLLETVREYAHELLEQHGEAADLRSQHARFFCDLAEAAFPAFYSADRQHWIEILEPEIGNFDAALQWCIDDVGDPELGLRLAGALGRFWYFIGQVNEGRAWLTKAIRAHAGAPASLTMARAHYVASKLAWVQGDYRVAEKHGEQAVAIASEYPESLLLVDALTMLGYALISTGRHEESLAAFTDSLEAARRQGATWQAGFAMAMASEATRLAGDLERCRAYLSEALEIFESLGDPWGIAVTHAMTAGLMKDLGDPEAMLKHVDLAEAAISQMQVEKYLDVALKVIRAFVYLLVGDHARAAAQFDLALTSSLEFGQMAYILVSLAGIAGLAAGGGRSQESAVLFGVASPVLDPDGLYVDDAGQAARETFEVCLPMLQAALTPEQFDAAWSRGRDLRLESAVELARAIARSRPEGAAA